MRPSLLALPIVALLGLAPQISRADCLTGARAYLTWSTADVQSDLPAPGDIATLYVRLEGAASFKGGEIELVWSPAGDDTCFAHIGTSFRTSGDCTYLNRGTTIPVVTVDEPGNYHVAWSNTESNEVCASGGNAIALQFELDGCADPTGCFVLKYMQIIDGANIPVPVTVCGTTATVQGGSSFCSATNRPPVITPVPDFQTIAGQTLTFSVFASDPDYDAVTLSASHLPPGSTFSGSVFTWINPVVGEYTVGFLAVDPFGAAAADSTHISVLPDDVNHPPVLAPIADTRVVETQTLSIFVTGSDVDGDALTYSADLLPPGATFIGQSMSWTPPIGADGTYSAVFRVTDTGGLFATDSVTIKVTPLGTGNADATAALSFAPAGVTSFLPNPSATVKVYIRLENAGSYAGGEADLTWFPPLDQQSCLTHSSTQYRNSIDCTYLNRGATTPIVTSDEPGHFHVTWSNSVANVSCAAGNAVVMFFDLGACLEQDACFTLTSMKVFDALGTLTDARLAGQTAVLNNGSDLCGQVNHSPVFLDPVPDQEVTEAQTLTFSVLAEDADGDSLTYEVRPLPEGAAFADRTFTWTPAVGQAGAYDVEFRATDPLGALATDRVTITVNPITDVIFVDGSSPCTPCDGNSWATAYHTFTEAIGDAQANAHDSIFVAEGRYFEQNLQPPTTTIIQGGYPRGGGERDVSAHFAIIETPAPNASLPILNIQNSRVTVDGVVTTGIRAGNSVVVVAADSVALRSLIVSGNAGLDSAAVTVLRGRAVSLDRVLIAGNAIASSGQALVYVAAGAKVALDDCTMSHDSTSVAGGPSGLLAAGDVHINNTIMWGLRPLGNAVINVPPGGNVAVTYSDVAHGWTGEGNVDLLPSFCSPRQRRFGLHTTSPLVGIGRGGTTIGAYEVECLGPAEEDAPWIDTSPWHAPVPTAVDDAPRATLALAAPTVARTPVAVTFALPSTGPATLEVFDVHGALVQRLAAGDLPAGPHTRTWLLDRTDGHRVPSGVYTLRLFARGDAAVRRVYVMR